jgi:CobQ-like glutamine amidotransferase family enzyme
MTTKHTITIGWLYPILMSTYGDRGNVIVLQKIAQSAGLDIQLKRIDQNSDSKLLTSCDLLFMGGAQDLQQEIVNKDLLENKGEILKEMIENGTPGLYICGAYQFLGNYYKDSYGTKIAGLGVFDMYTESFETKPRLTGNIVIQPIQNTKYKLLDTKYIGFENHGGRTYLVDHDQAFAKVLRGYGNNGEDRTEGIHYKNSIGTYLHGPILPSNPELATYLLKLSYEKKYEQELEINFNDELSKKARHLMLNRAKTSY